MSFVRTIVVLCPALVACGSRDLPAPPSSGSTSSTVAAAPGIDLSGPLPLPERGGVRRGAAAPAMLDLVADRALVRVDVPVPPRGGAVGFTFGDARTGWVTRTPEGVRLPAVAFGRDRVYVSGGFESTTFYALNAHSGAIEWATTELEDNGPTAAVYEDDRVLFNTESCTLFALDARTGKRLWLRRLGDPTLAQIAVADGLVFASHPGDGGQELSAYKVTTGEPVWSSSIDAELLASPVVAGEAVYVSTLGGVLYKFTRTTGHRQWARALRATTAPWVVGDELYVARRDGDREQQIVVAADTGKVVREHAKSRGSYTDDVPTSIGAFGDTNNFWKQVWTFEGSRPVVDRGVRYVAMGGDVLASDATTGDPLWTRHYAGADANARSIGSVALAGSELVISTRDGKLFGLDVDTGYTLWSYDLAKRVVAEPVIAEGWVYATTDDGFVVALQVGDRSLDGWHMFGGNPQHDGAVLPPPPTSREQVGRQTAAL